MRRIRKNVLKRTKTYKDIKALDNDSKRRLSPSVRKYELRLATLEVYEGAIRRLFTLLIVSLAVSSIWWGPFLFFKSAPQMKENFTILDIGIDSILRILMTGSVAGMIMVAPMLMVVLLPPKGLRFINHNKIMMGWFSTSQVISGILLANILIKARDNPPTVFEQGLAVGLMGITSYFAVAFGLLSIFAIAMMAFEKRKQDYYPEAVITDSFLNILSLVEKQPMQWGEGGFKRKLITEIEKAASCIERNLPYGLRSRNRMADAWMKESSEQMAAAVRELVKWVFTPKEDTRERFIERIASYLTYAARGDWDSFERIQPEKLSRPELFRSRLVGALTVIVSGGIPLLVLLLVKRLNLVEGAALTYLTVGAYIWAALTVLSNLDPLYGTKLAALKDISSILPLPGKEKK